MNRITYHYYGAMLSFDVDDDRLEVFDNVIKENGGELVEIDSEFEGAGE